MSKSGKATYFRYHMSWDMAFCHGPVDALWQVYIREKSVLLPGQQMLAPGFVDVSLNDYFGGNDKEGGFIGRITFFDGKADQLMTPELAQRVGLTPQTAPGYRGLAHVAVHGNDETDQPGAYFAANYPQQISMWADMGRLPTSLPTNKAGIGLADGRINANPASIIHEVITNEAWGMGGQATMLDEAKWLQAAGTLFDEDFGLSLLWTRQEKIEDFIRIILEHISGMVYFNPYTGKGVLKLLRDDYDRNALTTFGKETVTLKAFNRKLFGETINSLSLAWTDPVTEQKKTVTYQDNGNVEQQGEVISESVDFFAIRDEALAALVCQRELRAKSTPLASVQFTTDRRSFRHPDDSPIMPGDCVKLHWEFDDGTTIDNVVLRVFDIDWGTVSSSVITVNLTEDIFSIDLGQYSLPGGPVYNDPGYQPPEQDPNSADILAFPMKFFAAPYTLIQQDFGDDQVPPDEAYPQILMGAILAPIPPVYDTLGHRIGGQPDMQSFNLLVPDVDTTGTPGWTPAGGEKTLSGKAIIKGELIQEVQTVMNIDMSGKFGGDGPVVGGYGFLSNHPVTSPSGDRDFSEHFEEWVLFEAKIGKILIPVNGEDKEFTQWRVRRGVLDTTPKKWADNTTLFFIAIDDWDGWDTEAIGSNYQETDPHVYVENTYKVQPRTTLGYASIDVSPVWEVSRPDRPYRPYRPANVKLQGVMFGGRDDSQGGTTYNDPSDDTWEPREIWTYGLTWSRRNRKMEETVVYRWDGADIGPEDGQSTAVKVHTYYDGGGGVSEVVDYGHDATGGDFDILLHTAQYETLSLEFVSQRSGMESIQGHTINLSLYIKGYGSDFGYMYGGWPPGPFLSQINSELTMSMFTAGVGVA